MPPLKALAPVLMIAASLLYPFPVLASSDQETPSLLESAKLGFSYSSRALLFVDTQDPGNSTQNPDNAFLRLYRYSGELHVRPDFFLELPYVSGLFKPRAMAYYRWWKDGVVAEETDSDSRFFVNEWRIQVRPVPELFLSFGKEKLLWGPSFLASPSNIFFKDTEKTRPKNEIEGKYFAKIQYLPNDVVTFSLISNTQKQDDGLSDSYRPLHALKTEVMGNNFLVSLIGYEQRESRFRMGSFGQWTASDSVILYYDGVAQKGSDALYPNQDPGLPLGGEFVRKYEDSSRIFFTAVAGGSYTTLSGSTMTLEFLYNSEGYGDAEALDYYDLRKNASDHYFDTTPLSGLSQKTLAESLTTGLPFLRRYYLMAQYQEKEIKNVLDVILRYAYSIEEDAGAATTIVEWKLSDRMSLFNINNISTHNDENNEYNSLIRNSFMLGVEAHF
jgi:hypothetical protein